MDYEYHEMVKEHAEMQKPMEDLLKHIREEIHKHSKTPRGAFLMLIEMMCKLGMLNLELIEEYKNMEPKDAIELTLPYTFNNFMVSHNLPYRLKDIRFDGPLNEQLEKLFQSNDETLH